MSKDSGFETETNLESPKGQRRLAHSKNQGMCKFGMEGWAGYQIIHTPSGSIRILRF